MKKNKIEILAISILLFMICGIVIPIKMSDGTENYTGVEKEVAQRTIQFIDYNYRSDPRGYFFDRFFTKARIEEVIYTPGICSFSKYSAITSHRTIFGIKVSVGRVSGCQMDGDRGPFEAFSPYKHKESNSNTNSEESSLLE